MSEYNFREVKPIRNRVLGKKQENLNEKVKAGFIRHSVKAKNGEKVIHILSLLIGIDVAKEIGVKLGDKVKIFVAEDSPRTLLITACRDGVGHTASKLPKSSTAPMLRVLKEWQEFVPKETEFATKNVEFEFTRGGIVVFLGGRLPT